METIELNGLPVASGHDCPASLKAVLDAPPLARKGWQWTLAPTYIGLFFWMVFFDQLGARTLAIGGLGWSLLGVAIAAVLCNVLLYHVPATWGQKTGWPATVLAGSTFGTHGAVALVVLVFGVAQIVWLAVATYYSADWIFQGLTSCGLLAPKTLRPVVLPLGLGKGWHLYLRSPLFLITSAMWVCWASLTGRYLVKIIQAIMNIYPVFAAVMFALAMVWTLGGVPEFQARRLDPVVAVSLRSGGPRAVLLTIQMIVGFFAMAGLAAADWGAVNRAPRDVRLGGWVGVTFASWTVATLALLTIAGALGRVPAPQSLSPLASQGSFTYASAIVLGLPDKVGGLVFFIFGLSSLAPTVYAAHLFGQRLNALVPEVSQLKWALLGAALSWPLIATGLAGRLETIFTVMGAVFAPMVGALAADYVRSRSVWPGLRPGFNPPGMTAWAAGVAIGLVPLVLSASGLGDGTRFQPAVLFAFLTAFVVYLGLAAVGLDRPVIAVPVAASADVPAAEQPRVAVPEPQIEAPAES